MLNQIKQLIKFQLQSTYFNFANIFNTLRSIVSTKIILILHLSQRYLSFKCMVHVFWFSEKDGLDLCIVKITCQENPICLLVNASVRILASIFSTKGMPSSYPSYKSTLRSYSKSVLKIADLELYCLLL